jgi:hypothetical protein
MSYFEATDLFNKDVNVWRKYVAASFKAMYDDNIR